jgi:hypothetical protein
MSWVISGKTDPDFAAYIAAVEQADGQTLEVATRQAIYNFIIGCKSDGIWSAIKASCILAGARTLAGALVPLVGTAPTNVGGLFVADDYNRKTGLVGDASTKALSAGISPDAMPLNSIHASVYASSIGTTGYGLGVGETTNNAVNLGAATPIYRLNSAQINAGGLTLPGFNGINRSLSSEFIIRRNSANEAPVLQVSTAARSESLRIFDRGNNPSDARLAFYSIGESLDLALLDARVTDLINAFDAAI